MPADHLTDRYVWAVLRSRADEPARRSSSARSVPSIADATEAKAADGTLDADAAERAALEELGDPDALATGYTGQDPAPHRPERLPGLEGPAVGPALDRRARSSGLAVLGANLIGGATVGQAIVAGLGTRLHGRDPDAVLVHPRLRPHRALWRRRHAGGAGRDRGLHRRADVRHPHHGRWTVADLPEIPDDGRITVGELAGSLISNVLLLGFLLWVVPGSPQIPMDDEAFAAVRPGAVVVLAAVVHRHHGHRDRVHDPRVPPRSVDVCIGHRQMPCWAPRSSSRPCTCLRTTCCSTRPSSRPSARPRRAGRGSSRPRS